MLNIAGMGIVLACVFGGYLAAGGKMGVILKALPFELLMIGGAGLGAYVIANDARVLKKTFADLKAVLSGPKWKEEDCRDLLCLLFNLIKLARRDAVALEGHVERPDESAIFRAYPKIAADKEAVATICDTMRLTSMSFDDPHQLEDMLEKRLSAKKHKATAAADALQALADGLPALGIVAAVLGIIKTMSSIDKPPEVLGGMIGSALVGTFLGVFLAYGFVGPLSTRIRHIAEHDHHFHVLIRDTLVANLHRHSPQICVEVGRQTLPGSMRPGYDALDEALRAEPAEAA